MSAFSKMAHHYTNIRPVWHTYSQQIYIFFLSLSYHSRRHLRSLRRFLILRGSRLQNILKCADWFVYRGQSFGFFLMDFYVWYFSATLQLVKTHFFFFHSLTLFRVIWFCSHLDPWRQKHYSPSEGRVTITQLRKVKEINPYLNYLLLFLELV